MKEYKADKIRNVAIAGHSSSGKTSLAEAMLFRAGATDRLGKTADGNTVCDFDPEEVRRKVTISSTVAPLEWKDTKINLIDTPGLFDFAAGVSEGVRAAESVLIVVSAKSGVEVGTEKAYKIAGQMGKSKLFYINQMDAENADFYKVLDQLKEVFGSHVCPMVVPYVENHKVSDWLVPYTSSGCRAMCLYCYLVCNYNKCAYLRLFVNREQMMGKLIKASLKASMPQTFEIGSNSDLVLENAITNNLIWTIENFAKEGRGFLTFPTKFDMVKGLLSLDHRGKTISRMSVNPIDIIRRVELGTSPLGARITALNAMAEAGYPVGLLIAPVILLPNWKAQYGRLIDQLADTLSEKVKRSGFIEVIFMTYSFVQNAINLEAFPNALPIFDQSLMTGRGRGKYCYKPEVRADAEAFLREQIGTKLSMNILYIT
mgnify:CR=1 FL=1